MRLKLTWMVMLFFTALQLSFAQEKTVKGTVKDASGVELPGVAVQIKGEQRGTETDFDGNYSLQVAPGKILVFSYLGMKNVEKTVGNSNTINVVMEEDTHQLGEVVVTGVGTATDKRKVAISVDAVSEDALKKNPVKSIDAALTGKVAGAQIQSTSGQPGQQSNIILRGINSLGTTQPMIMVDGVEINASSLGMGSSGSSNVSSRLADLDLSNVERVEVIQGAAAATIYGAQGANGVIQIFTKKGKKGQRTEITFNSSLSVDNALVGNLSFAKKHFYKTNADGYIVDGAGKPIAVDPQTGYWTLPDESVDGNSINDKPYKEKTYNHLKQYYKTAYTKQHSLNITGASGNVDYSLGFAYLNQNSPVHGDYDKKNITANLGVELFNGFTLRSGTQLVTSNNTTGGVNGRNSIYSGANGAFTAHPFVDLKFRDSKGNPFVNYDDSNNGVMPFYSYHNLETNVDVNRVIQNISANYKINKFVELDYKYGVDYTRYDDQEFIKNQKMTATSNKGITPLEGKLTKRLIRETYQNSLASAFLKFNFERDFGWNFPLQSTTQLAYDWRKQNYNRVTGTGTGFGQAPPFTLSTAKTSSSSEYLSEFVTFGYVVNQKFDYADLFGFSFGVRSDYSSTFGEGAKPFTFPRGDVYFRVGELIKSQILSEFKLRAAYGEAGIQPQAYDRMITLSSDKLGDQGYFYLPSVARNPALGVQNSKEFEVGLDYGLQLSNKNWFTRFNGNVVYWTRESLGLVYDIETPPSQGSVKIKDNAINLKSDGIQASLDIDMFRSKDFDWTFGVRFSKTKTLVDKISNGKTIVIGSGGSGQTALKEGEPVGAFYGLQPLSSLNQTNSKGERYIEDTDLSKYELVNGMVVNKDTKQVQFTSEQTKIGDATPDFTMSFFNDFTIAKKLTMSVQVDWVQGADVYNATRQWLYLDKVHGDLDMPITVDGKTGAFVNYYVSLYNTNNVHSYFVEDGSYVRLRNVSLTYDASKHLQNTFIKGLNLTLSGRNLLTFTNYSGLDPEAVGTNVNNPLYRGIDLWSFPNMRTVTLGVNLRF
ncbi:SusC/RagA family TonB-linked outer membrane protein [Capnocytophaga canimorsus]